MNKTLPILLVASVSLLGCNQPSQESSASQKKSEKPSTTIENRLASVEADVENLLKQMTLEEKISMTHASGKFHVNAIERLGIPELWLSDGPHGVRYQIQRDSWDSAGWDDDYSTYLPHLTSVAASWDVEMATLHGNVLGAEARDRKKDIILGPGVNLARLPLYGRNFEYMGEDPFLAGALVVPEVKAIQSHDVSANVKHYALNTQELNRIGVNAKPDERTLREVYLYAFEQAVKEGGAYSLMGAYNEYYGTNANQSEHLVKNILKGEWGFDGVLLTDWNVDINTYDAAMNGLDLEMGTDVASYDDYFFAQPFLQMIKEGKIPESVLDDKVRRVLRLMHRVGLFDENRKQGSRNTKEHQLAARKIASEGVVLLKNELNVLPLQQEKLKKVLVIGPNSNKVHGLGGGSSEVKTPYEITPLQGLQNALGEQVEIQVMRARSNSLAPIAADYIASKHWTGTPAWNISNFQDAAHKNLLSESWLVNAHFLSKDDKKEQFITMSADIKPVESGIHTLKLQLNGNAKLSVDGKLEIEQKSDSLQIFEHKINLNAGQSYKFELHYNGSHEVLLGWDAPGDLFSPEEEYLAAAKDADAVIYFGGLTHGDDREAIDRSDMKLPGSQDEVITKLLEANANTVVFLVAGSAVEMPWHKQANTIVWGWYGGMEAGNAFAEVLFGRVNPSGKLPITLPEKLENTAPIMLDDYNAVDSLYKEGVLIGYRWFDKKNIDPIFAFGHGLSYSEFEYSDIQLSSTTVSGDDKLTVTATITNTSDIAGAEVVQLYLSDLQSSVVRPVRELKGFTKVFLQPKESKQVSLTLNKRDLSFWDVNTNDWLVEPGQFEVSLAASSRDLRLKAQFNYQ